jgi:hypothetical protein
MESSTRKMVAKKPQCTMLHQELLASPSHCEVIIEKQTRIFHYNGVIHHNPILGNIGDTPA